MVPTTHPHTLVGVFRGADAAFAALRQLDDDGIPPHHVGLVAGDPVLASEAGSHDHARAGAVGGFVAGVAVSVLYVVVGDASFHQNPVGPLLGGAFIAIGLAFIGSVMGRALVVHPSHHGEYEHAVQDGGAIVTIECAGDECDRARSVLRHAHADDVVDEFA